MSRTLFWRVLLTFIAVIAVMLMSGPTATGLAAEDSFPYWVKTIKEARLWDGADAKAKSRVSIPAESYFAVTGPVSKGRLPVVELTTQRNGFLNTDDVERGAPPPEPASVVAPTTASSDLSSPPGSSAPAVPSPVPADVRSGSRGCAICAILGIKLFARVTMDR